MKTQDISIKLNSYPIIWIESNFGIISQTSVGNVYISKKYKKAYIHTPFSTTVQFYENIKDIDKLKQKVEEYHTRQINKVQQLWTKVDIKIK